MVSDLYGTALENGIGVDDFWDMTIPEVVDTIKARMKQRENAQKDRLRLVHFLAKDVAQVFGSDKDNPPKELWDFFPELFAEDKEEAEKANAEAEFALYKARMIDFALRHNNVRKEAGAWKE